MDKRKFTISATLFLVALGAAWAFGFIGGGDPVVAEMQQLRDQMFTNRDLPDDQRRAQWQEFRQRMDGLTDDQRRAFREGGREQWQQMAQQRMDEFFALPPAQQRERLDDIIDRMQERQRDRAQNGNQANRGDRGGRGDRGANLSDSQREQRRKERLDRTSPKMRAQASEFRDRLDDRMKERGLPPIEGRGPGGFGGRGGPWRG
jgi:hypothetical protein